MSKRPAQDLTPGLDDVPELIPDTSPHARTSAHTDTTSHKRARHGNTGRSSDNEGSSEHPDHASSGSLSSTGQSSYYLFALNGRLYGASQGPPRISALSYTDFDVQTQGDVPIMDVRTTSALPNGTHVNHSTLGRLARLDGTSSDAESSTPSEYGAVATATTAAMATTATMGSAVQNLFMGPNRSRSPSRRVDSTPTAAYTWDSTVGALTTETPELLGIVFSTAAGSLTFKVPHSASGQALAESEPEPFQEEEEESPILTLHFAPDRMTQLSISPVFSAEGHGLDVYFEDPARGDGHGGDGVSDSQQVEEGSTSKAEEDEEDQSFDVDMGQGTSLEIYLEPGNSVFGLHTLGLDGDHTAVFGLHTVV